MKCILSNEIGQKNKAIKMGKTHRMHLLFVALIYFSLIILVILSIGYSLRAYSLGLAAKYRSSSASSVPDFTNYILHGPNLSEIGPLFTYATSINDTTPRLLHYLTWHAKQMNCIRNSSC